MTSGRRTSTLVDTTRTVVLARRPGARLVAEDLEVRELPVPALTAGQALVRNELMSLDPSTRGRMDATDKVYTTNFELGGPLDGWAVGQVVESRTLALPVGATVRHRLGWRELAVVDDTSARVVDVSAVPAASWLSALGQTGFTAYVGVTAIGAIRPGETFFVSAAAGGVGSVAGQLARLHGCRAGGRVCRRRGQVRVVDRHARLRRRDRLPGRESTGQAGRAGPRDRPLLRQRGRRAADRGAAQHADRVAASRCAAWCRRCRAATRNRPSAPSSRPSFAG